MAGSVMPSPQFTGLSGSGPASHGFSQRSVCRPTQQDTTFERVMCHTGKPGPLGDRMPLAAKFQHAVRSAVVRLLPERCPSAISGRVVAVDVDAVKGMPCRTWTHVTEKRAEVVAPFVRHRNAAATVRRIRALLLVVAARLRGAPSAIFTSTKRLVFRCAFPTPLVMKATATARVASSQVLTDDIGRQAAVALTAPCRSSATVLGALNNQQTPESSATHLYKHAAHPYHFTRSAACVW